MGPLPCLFCQQCRLGLGLRVVLDLSRQLYLWRSKLDLLKLGAARWVSISRPLHFQRKRIIGRTLSRPTTTSRVCCRPLRGFRSEAGCEAEVSIPIKQNPNSTACGYATDAYQNLEPEPRLALDPEETKEVTRKQTAEGIVTNIFRCTSCPTHGGVVLGWHWVFLSGALVCGGLQNG